MIPEAAVEAAAHALFEKELGRPMEVADEGLYAEDIGACREDARAALEAAAPHMLREAWDEGSVAGWVESGVPHSWGAENSLRNANPYRSAK